MADETKNILIHIKGKVDDFNKKYDSVTKKADALKQKFQQVAQFIAGAYVAGRIINSIKAIIRETIEWGVTTDKISKVLGMASEDVQRFAYAMEQEHGSIESFQKGILNLTTALGYAGQEQKVYIDYFKELGIEYRKADGTLKSAQDVFLELSDIMQRGTLTTEKQAAAMMLLSKRAFKDLVPALKKGSEWFKEMGDEAERLRIVLSKDMVDALKLADDNMTRLSTTTKGLKIQLGVGLIPQIDVYVNALNDMLLVTRRVKGETFHMGKALFNIATLLGNPAAMFFKLRERMKELNKEQESYIHTVVKAPKPLEELTIKTKKLSDAEVKRNELLREQIALTSKLEAIEPTGTKSFANQFAEMEIMLPKTISQWDMWKEEIKGLDGTMQGLGETLGMLLTGNEDFLKSLLKTGLQLALMQMTGGAAPFLSGFAGGLLPFGKGGMTAIPRAAEGLVTKVDKPMITRHGVAAGEKYQTEWIFTGDQLSNLIKAMRTTIVVHNAHSDTIVEEIGGLSESGQFNLQRILNNNILSKGNKLNR